MLLDVWLGLGWFNFPGVQFVGIMFEVSNVLALDPLGAERIISK